MRFVRAASRDLIPFYPGSVAVPSRPVLETRRLVLVPETLAAARALLEGEDPGLPLGEGYPHAESLDALRMFVLSAAAGEQSASGGWFITLRDSGQVIGDCGTKGWVDDHGRVEIGYGLAGAWRRRGLGTEAVGTLVGWLSRQADVSRIVAEVEVGNVASRRLLERLGFEVTATEGSLWQLELPAVRPE